MTPGSDKFHGEGTLNEKYIYNIQTDIATTRLTRLKGSLKRNIYSKETLLLGLIKERKKTRR